MQRQLRALLINDVTGFGRCSIASMLPILSALKIHTSFIPTAILSLDTYFDNYYFYDFTNHLPSYINSYKECQLSFDAIASGFLGSAEQVDVLIQSISDLKTESTLVFVDPIMGDHGKLYPVYTKEMCDKMRQLVAKASLITPNLTELLVLCEKDYQNTTLTIEDIIDLCKQVASWGPQQIVVTGIERDKQITNLIYENEKVSEVTSDKIGKDRSGTGDVFSAVVLGSYLQGQELVASVKKATNFVTQCITYTERLQLPFNHGLCFEEYLTTL